MKSKTAHRLPRLALGTLAVTASLFSAPSAFAQVPDISVSNSKDWLQAGNPNDAYWIENNPWGAAALTEGTASSQYEQYVGRSSSVGPDGEVAFRTKWRWPQGTTEVKGYPSVLYGRKPGYGTTSAYVNGYPIRLPDGTISQTSNGGATPGTIFPMQLPLQSLKAKFNYAHNAAPTGQGHLSFDIWLQSNPKQDAGWMNSSITHEIMIPLTNWGGYGSHPSGRNPNWYDHDAVIGGKLYHVYATKRNGCLNYDFGGLNGAYGKTGWKMIAFVPDVMPVAAGEIDLAAIINYLATRKDACGQPWGLGNEYLVSAELGVEPVVGTGDLTVYDFKISKGSASSTPTTTTPTAPTTTTPTAPTTTTPTTTTYANWVMNKSYAAGNIVSYNGKLYVAKYANPGYNPTISTYYWAPYTAPATTTTAPVATTPTPTAPATTTYASWVSGKSYAAGNIVNYNGSLYVAKYANPGYNPTISTYYWAPYTAAVTTTTATSTTTKILSCGTYAAWQASKYYTSGDIVSNNGALYVARGSNFVNIAPTDARYWSRYYC